MKKLSPHVFALLTAILLSIPWLVNYTGILLLFAWAPLLYTERKLSSSYKPIWVWLIGFFSFLSWNLFTTWWLYCVSESYYTKLFASIFPIVFNALLMSIPWIMFHHTRKKLGDRIGYFSFICYWISFEYIHLNWELSWPWLTLGNGFSTSIHLIQWYEYTGTLGGSLWILLSNISLLYLFESFVSKKEKFIIKKQILVSAFLIFLPTLISIVIFYNYQEKSNPVNIVIVQPNIDPYNQKFDLRYHKQHLHKMLSLAASKTDSTTDYFVGPETALVAGLWENDIPEDESIDTIRNFVKQFPKLKAIIGASTFIMYDPKKPHPATARPYGKKGKLWYDAFNTALQIDHSDSVQIYHKSKLVTGSEKMPYPEALRFLEPLALDLGGIVGTLGIQEEPSVFYSPNDSLIGAPAICYESAYGEYLAEYIRKGAQLIFVITNDGWWDKTPGHKQHLSFSSLRAIETRRPVARSANTGISCFINQKGEISQPTKWWVSDVIKEKVNANTELSFYVKYGDYIAFILSFFSIFLLIWLIIKKIKP